MRAWIVGIAFLLVASVGWAEEIYTPLSPRSVLPAWVKDESSLQFFLQKKYFQAPEACEPIQEDQWICHIVYGGEGRIDTVIDFKRRREVTLPRTQANYYLIPNWQTVVSVAFISSRQGWDLSLVWMNLNDLMVNYRRLFPALYQSILSFSLTPKGKKIGFDIQYCLESGCWHDEFRIKRGQLLLKSHMRLPLINP